MRGACNKGSSKVGKDFCSCARIMQYCHDNIKVFFFFSPILLEGPADIMIAYIGALQGNCILCQGGQHLTRKATQEKVQRSQRTDDTVTIVWCVVHFVDNNIMQQEAVLLLGSLATSRSFLFILVWNGSVLKSIFTSSLPPQIIRSPVVPSTPRRSVSSTFARSRRCTQPGGSK